MSGRAETVEPEASCLARLLQRSPSDQSGAQKRRQRHRVCVGIQIEGKAGIGDDAGREPAVACVSREQRAVAQVFGTEPAIGAGSAAVAKPGHAGAPAYPGRLHIGSDRLDDADDLVSRDER